MPRCARPEFRRSVRQSRPLQDPRQVLLTTENFPDVFRPAYHLNVPIALVYFLSYFILGVWMLMSLLLAIIYSHYKEKHTDKMRRSQLSEQKSLLTAFIIMQDNGEPLSFRKWCALLKHVKPWATSEGLKVLFDSLDDDKDGCITIQEFFRVPEVLSYRLTRTLVQEEVTESCSSVGSWLNSIGRRPVASLAVVVVTQVFETGVHYIALLNAVALFVEGSTQSSTLQGVMQGFNALLLLCFGFEMLCRWSAIGLFALVRDWGMDLLVVVLSFASRADPDVYKYMMALQVTRVVTTHAALRGLVHTFKECLPMVLQMLTLGVCICYTYAAMGLEAFGTTVVEHHRPYCNEKSPAPSSPPRSLHEEAPMLARPHHRHVSEDLCIDHIENFETPGHALLALFQIMTGNNWNDVMYPNALGSDISGASMYFISFYFIAVLLLINLMTSLILDIYISRNDLLDQRGENVGSRFRAPSRLFAQAGACCAPCIARWMAQLSSRG
ncbi:hypothetical protein CYMTET_37546 [Cymbomonas tetramitiformis]|uniref:EF-hand domain-containing protein n=1 Tax=Cymbomonas tetramitiformis TaxID=36881 RepID=A0AAE0CDU3_9CHLO|nr:hypothetical protein CYMTET_37546 [Cymbomonas tetramitiformis]